jgi:hypothetical protein
MCVISRQKQIDVCVETLAAVGGDDDRVFASLLCLPSQSIHAIRNESICVKAELSGDATGR